MFTRLSSDITLYVLSFLTLRDAVNLHLLSRSTRSFLLDHEGAIFHQLAVLHRFAESGTLLEDAVASQKHHGNWLGEVKTWKDLCRRYYELERNWSGRGTITEGGYTSYSSNVRGFRVDEHEQTILAVHETSPKWTLSVNALEDGRLLWTLPAVNGIDASGGYLLLWRNNGGIEIWRRAKDALSSSSTTPSPLREPSPLAATATQIRQSPLSGERADARRDLRGVYVPHGFLPSLTGSPFRICRLRSPLLAAVNADASHTVVLYDVEQGVLLRTIDVDAVVLANAPTMHPNQFVLLDLDLAEDFLCVCFDMAVVVLPLRDGVVPGHTSSGGPPAMVLTDKRSPWDLQDTVPRLTNVEIVDRTGTHGGTIRTQQNLHYIEMSGADAFEVFRAAPPPPKDEVESQALIPRGQQRTNSMFISARFSPDGRHLIAGAAFSLLYLVPDFRRVLRGTADPGDVMQKFNMKEPIRYLLWDAQDFRVAVQTVHPFPPELGDIFVIDLNPSYHAGGSSDPGPSFEHARILRLRDPSSPYGTAFGNMQIRKTGLWFVWDLPRLRANVRKKVQDNHQTLVYGSKDERGTADVDEKGISITVCFVNFV